MNKLLLSYSIAPVEEKGLLTLIQYARERGIEVLLPDRTPSGDGSPNWYTTEALRQCTGVWGLITAAGNANDWVRHELSLARGQLLKPVVLFVEQGANWQNDIVGATPVYFDRSNVDALLSQFLANVDGWLHPKPEPKPAASGAGVLGAIGAGLLLYWLLKDNK
ncbi:MAG: hypothetical protein BroJett014_04040 [Planctomycetota bacterium]|nr:hypothetical protein [Planctomycetota bacterium]GIK51431.1 MAG: hypothetical protein BroJett014_04040 [Planctomycetota bacterium]